MYSLFKGRVKKLGGRAAGGIGKKAYAPGMKAPEGARRCARGGSARQVYGKLVTLGVTEQLMEVTPPVALMTLLIPPLDPMQTVIMLWNLTLTVFGTSMAL
jgi:hypothetical protein